MFFAITNLIKPRKTCSWKPANLLLSFRWSILLWSCLLIIIQTSPKELQLASLGAYHQSHINGINSSANVFLLGYASKDVIPLDSLFRTQLLQPPLKKTANIKPAGKARSKSGSTLHMEVEKLKQIPQSSAISIISTDERVCVSLFNSIPVIFTPFLLIKNANPFSAFVMITFFLPGTCGSYSSC